MPTEKSFDELMRELPSGEDFTTSQSLAPASLLLRVPPALEHVAKASIECERFIREESGDDGLAARVELVVSEVLNNIIEHGQLPQTGPPILVTLTARKQVSVRFLDRGVEWNALPTVGEDDVDLYASRGRGMQIVRAFTTDLFRRRTDGVNETTLVMSNE